MSGLERDLALSVVLERSPEGHAAIKMAQEVRIALSKSALQTALLRLARLERAAGVVHALRSWHCPSKDAVDELCRQCWREYHEVVGAQSPTLVSDRRSRATCGASGVDANGSDVASELRAYAAAIRGEP